MVRSICMVILMVAFPVFPVGLVMWASTAGISALSRWRKSASASASLRT